MPPASRATSAACVGAARAEQLFSERTGRLGCKCAERQLAQLQARVVARLRVHLY